MPAGDMPQRERRAAVTYLVEHAIDMDVMRVYGASSTRTNRSKHSIASKAAPTPTPTTARATPKSVSKAKKEKAAPAKSANEGKKQKLKVSATSSPTTSSAAAVTPALTASSPVAAERWVYPVSMTGGRLPMRFDPTMTVATFMKRLEHVHGIPVASQRYYVGTREWRSGCEDKTLADMGLFDGCVFLLANKVG